MALAETGCYLPGSVDVESLDYSNLFVPGMLGDLINGESPSGLEYLTSQSPEDIARINAEVAAIIVATKKGGHKITHFREVADASGLALDIRSASPHRIVEDKFNHLTGEPPTVAALKVLQLSDNPREFILGLLGELPDKLVLMLASDVILDLENTSTGEWVSLNKFRSESGKDEIYQSMYPLLCGYQDIRRARIRVGEAVFEPWLLRGALHTEEVHIKYQPLTPEELALYVYGAEGARAKRFDVGGLVSHILSSREFSLEDVDLILKGSTVNELTSTNAGVRWGHPLFRVLEINGRRPGEHDYAIVDSMFRSGRLGVPSQRNRFMAASIPFITCVKNVKGNRSLAREAAAIGLDPSKSGVWFQFQREALLGPYS